MYILLERVHHEARKGKSLIFSVRLESRLLSVQMAARLNLRCEGRGGLVWLQHNKNLLYSIIPSVFTVPAKSARVGFEIHKRLRLSVLVKVVILY